MMHKKVISNIRFLSLPFGEVGGAAFGASLFLLLLSACSDSSETLPGSVRGSEEAAVTFRTASVTRAAALNDTDGIPESGRFGVSGYYCTGATVDNIGEITSANVTDGAILDNEPVTRNGSAYTYANTRYWPTNEEVGIQFFAWYPYGTETVTETDAKGNSVTTEKGVTAQRMKSDLSGVELDYTVPADTPDMLYAVTSPLNKYVEWKYQRAGNETDGYTPAEPNPVPLDFKHALSQISFKIAKSDSEDNGVAFFIRRIDLYAVNQGTLTLPTAKTGTASWKVVSEYPAPDDETFTYGMFTLDFASETAKPDAVDADGTTMHYELCDYDNKYYPKVDASNPVYLNESGTQYLFMIPQGKPTIDNTSVTPRPTQFSLPFITIDYVYDNGVTGDGHIHVDGYATLSIGDLFSDTHKWEAGKAFVYTIKLGTSGSVILVSPTEWDDGTTGTSGDVVFN